MPQEHPAPRVWGWCVGAAERVTPQNAATPSRPPPPPTPREPGSDSSSYHHHTANTTTTTVVVGVCVELCWNLCSWRFKLLSVIYYYFYLLTISTVRPFHLNLSISTFLFVNLFLLAYFYLSISTNICLSTSTLFLLFQTPPTLPLLLLQPLQPPQLTPY